jgi:hypothetical protein
MTNCQCHKCDTDPTSIYKEQSHSLTVSAELCQKCLNNLQFTTGKGFSVLRMISLATSRLNQTVIHEDHLISIDQFLVFFVSR